MFAAATILNEREARSARNALSEIDGALSSEQIFEAAISGLPVAVVEKYHRALHAQRSDLANLLKAYEAAKSGNWTELKRQVGADPGLNLVVARIARGYSQKELARRLGLKEQQVQRYEAERYRSISLGNFRRVAQILGVEWDLKLDDGPNRWLGSGWDLAPDINADSVRKIISHAKQHQWFEDETLAAANKGDALEGGQEDELEPSYGYLKKYITDHITDYGSSALLRTGMRSDADVDDLLLIAWRARVTRVAEKIVTSQELGDRSVDIAWLRDLARLSQFEDGPARAKDFLLTKGIVLVYEPQITGLRLDGVAFMVGDVPVVGITGRRDTIDNFWFTLLHEIAHVILHYRIGLRMGFVDDFEEGSVDELECEANDFAGDLLIPRELWERSPARIAKSSATIERFAKQLGIHPAVVFGRIQKERNNYAIFSREVGRGQVRKWLTSRQGGQKP
jgi:HTH-type transcriptional regulator/antitoxin HigA